MQQQLIVIVFNLTIGIISTVDRPISGTMSICTQRCIFNNLREYDKFDFEISIPTDLLSQLICYHTHNPLPLTWHLNTSNTAGNEVWIPSNKVIVIATSLEQVLGNIH